MSLLNFEGHGNMLSQMKKTNNKSSIAQILFEILLRATENVVNFESLPSVHVLWYTLNKLLISYYLYSFKDDIERIKPLETTKLLIFL